MHPKMRSEKVIDFWSIFDPRLVPKSTPKHTKKWPPGGESLWENADFRFLAKSWKLSSRLHESSILTFQDLSKNHVFRLNRPSRLHESSIFDFLVFSWFSSKSWKLCSRLHETSISASPSELQNFIFWQFRPSRLHESAISVFSKKSVFFAISWKLSSRLHESAILASPVGAPSPHPFFILAFSPTWGRDFWLFRKIMLFCNIFEIELSPTRERDFGPPRWGPFPTLFLNFCSISHIFA